MTSNAAPLLIADRHGRNAAMDNGSVANRPLGGSGSRRRGAARRRAGTRRAARRTETQTFRNAVRNGEF